MKKNEEYLKISRKPISTSETSDKLTNKVSKIHFSDGSPLDNQTKKLMESRFGYDFSDVRIHTNKKAVKSAQSMSALAYTIGKDIVFGEGQFIPATDYGRRLLAHELAHVIQQDKSSIEQVQLQPDNTSSIDTGISRSEMDPHHLDISPETATDCLHSHCASACRIVK